MYCTTEKGEGRVMRVGSYDSWEDIDILIGAFSPDCVITFAEEEEFEKKAIPAFHHEYPQK